MSERRGEMSAVVIGGSAGAFEGITQILAALPAEFSLPIAIVLHVPAGKPSLLARVLDPYCVLPVGEVDDKQAIEPGNVYIAPPDYHLLVERTGHFSLSIDPPVHFSRPAIDVLFESAAEVYGPSLIGVLLSGANEDGALGLATIKRLGGVTIVQTLDSSRARTMPEAALKLSHPDHVLRVDEVGPLLAELALGRVAPPPGAGSDP